MPFVTVPDAPYSYSPDCYAMVYSFSETDTAPETGTTKVTDSKQGINGVVYDGDLEDALLVDTPFHLDSDIISFTMTKSKDRGAGTWEMTLAPSRDYHALISNGDQIFLWLKRNGNPEARVYDNSIASGFRLWGVITSVRRMRVTDSEGHKSTRYILSGEDFGRFFESEVFYNPIITDFLNSAGTAIAYSTLGGEFAFFASPEVNAVTILNAYLGSSLHTNWLPSGSAPNDVYKLPSPISGFFQASASTVASCMNIQAGLMSYSVDKSQPTRIDSLPGFKLLKIDPGMGGSLWSILHAYANTSVMNEMFLEMKPDAAGLKMVPTLVLRQIPYTSDEGAQELITPTSPNTPGIQTTTFSSLPRFRIPESAIKAEELGTSEGNRVNYMQIYGSGCPDNGLGDQVSQQTLLGNFFADKRSISRYGLHTKLFSTDHDIRYGKRASLGMYAGTSAAIAIATGILPGSFGGAFLGLAQGLSNSLGGTQPNQWAATEPLVGNGLSMVNDWIRVVTDWWARYHLYDTGTFHCIGIDEPLAVGDNLEVVRGDGSIELYHITTYSHSYSVDGSSGNKSFSTQIAVVRGQTTQGDPLSTEKGGNAYPTNFSSQQTKKVASGFGLGEGDVNG